MRGVKDQNTVKLRKKRRRRRCLRILASAFLLFAAGLTFAAVKVFQMDAWDKLDVSKIFDVDQSVIVYDGDGAEVLTLHALEDRIWIPLSEAFRKSLHLFRS